MRGTACFGRLTHSGSSRKGFFEQLQFKPRPDRWTGHQWHNGVRLRVRREGIAHVETLKWMGKSMAHSRQRQKSSLLGVRERGAEWPEWDEPGEATGARLYMASFTLSPAMSVSLPFSPADLIPRGQFPEGMYLSQDSATGHSPMLIPLSQSKILVSQRPFFCKPLRLEQDGNKRLICLEDISW